MSSKISIESALKPSLAPVLRAEPGSHHSGRYILRLLSCWFRYLLLCAAVKHERRRLAKLTDRELMDMGIDRIDAMRERNRSFFDIPANRLDD